MTPTTVEHRLTAEGTCTCGFASHKVRSVRIHITKVNAAELTPRKAHATTVPHRGTCDDSLCGWCGCCMHTGLTVASNCRVAAELPSGVPCPDPECGCGRNF
jgi:hypothetical protein